MKVMQYYITTLINHNSSVKDDMVGAELSMFNCYIRVENIHQMMVNYEEEKPSLYSNEHNAAIQVLLQ